MNRPEEVMPMTQEYMCRIEEVMAHNTCSYQRVYYEQEHYSRYELYFSIFRTIFGQDMNDIAVVCSK